jgi:hypothetical protein
MALDENKPKYESIPIFMPADVEAAIIRDNPDELLRAVLSASLHGDDPEWALSVCLRLSTHPHFNVRGNAMLAMGHIARNFYWLDRIRAQPVIELGLKDPNEFVRGQAMCAAEDIERYLGWGVWRID